MEALNPIQKIAVNIGADVLINSGAKLARNEALRRWVVSRVEKIMLSELKQTRTDPNWLPGIADDRTVMSLAILGTIERALVENRISQSSLRGLVRILVQSLFIEQGDQAAVERFTNQYGMRAPSFLVISPGKACNNSFFHSLRQWQLDYKRKNGNGLAPCSIRGTLAGWPNTMRRSRT